MSTRPISQMTVAQLQTAFLTFRGRILRHAQIYFRHIRCPHRRADCISEAIALSWQWFVRLARRGKDARQFPTVLACFAARATRNGRRVCGQVRAGDVLNELAQQRKCFCVGSLPSATCTSCERLYGAVDGQRRLDAFEERLRDNTKSPIPEQVAFRCDFPIWLGRWSERDQRIIQDMAQDERTTALARKYCVSPGRISQLRRKFYEDWQRFIGEPGDDASGPAPLPA